jgi:predicted nucleotidyltransferase
MKTIGIIAEYNPFHNGHASQFARIREQFGADTAIVVMMSGSFTQRGEPAVIDKWARTRMALAMGASLVIELPFVYATASAERFAAGGVQCLLATGVVGQLVFGSESGDLAALERIASATARSGPFFPCRTANGHRKVPARSIRRGNNRLFTVDENSQQYSGN